MKKVFFCLAAAVLCLGFVSCKKEEDPSAQYRKAFSGKYNLVSIFEINRSAFDLDGDGTASVTLLDEYRSMWNPSFSEFQFIKTGGGEYAGGFTLFVPLQGVSSGMAQPPYSIETPVTFSRGFGCASFAVGFSVSFSQDGTPVWQPALQENNTSSGQIYIALLHDAHVLKAENGMLDIIISEVPVYDFANKSYTLQSLIYHLEHV